MIELAAAHGHRLQAYQAEPTGDAEGTIVLIQEVFGVTPHLTPIADDYAAKGFGRSRRPCSTGWRPAPIFSRPSKSGKKPPLSISN